MIAELPDRAAFFKCLNSKFQVLNVEPGPLELELIAVSELQQSARQQSFSIIFLGPPDWLLPQHLYHLSHTQLGELELFLVPVGKTAQGYEYEAVFNHLIGETHV
jgi:hypothetical protein